MASLIPVPSDAVSRGQRGPLNNSDGAPPQARNPMPPHWKFSFEGSKSYATALEFVFKFLCLLSFGSRNLDELWSKMGEMGEGTGLDTNIDDVLNAADMAAVGNPEFLDLDMEDMDGDGDDVVRVHAVESESWYRL